MPNRIFIAPNVEWMRGVAASDVWLDEASDNPNQIILMSCSVFHSNFSWLQYPHQRFPKLFAFYEDVYPLYIGQGYQQQLR
eukprot:scaffold926_cov150-Chaetoceros_neogracile.AAC.5